MARYKLSMIKWSLLEKLNPMAPRVLTFGSRRGDAWLCCMQLNNGRIAEWNLFQYWFTPTSYHACVTQGSRNTGLVRIRRRRDNKIPNWASNQLTIRHDAFSLTWSSYVEAWLIKTRPSLVGLWKSSIYRITDDNNITTAYQPSTWSRGHVVWM